MKFLLLVLLALPQQEKLTEYDYAASFCAQIGGERQSYVENRKRVAEVDCLTEQYAIEVDFAYKWQECLGQAAFYGLLWQRDPGCALIVGPKDERFLDRARRTVDSLCIAIGNVCRRIQIFEIRHGP